MSSHGAPHHDLRGSRSYLASPSSSGIPPTAAQDSSSVAPAAQSYLRTLTPTANLESRRYRAPPQVRPPLYAESSAALMNAGNHAASEITLPGLRQVHLLNIPAIAVEEPLTEEQRDLYMAPALRSNRFGSGRRTVVPTLIEEMEHVARLPAAMRPAAQENLDARIGADLQKGQAASPAARIQELTRLREAHMAAAEEIRLEEVRTAERERQRLEALPSSDETMLALGGKTEAEIVQELQQMRRSVAKGPYLPTLPEGTPVMAAAPKSALKMPALPQPSYKRSGLNDDSRTAQNKPYKHIPAHLLQPLPHSAATPTISRSRPTLAPDAGLVPLERRGSVRPGSSVSNVQPRERECSRRTGLANVRYADSEMGLRPLAVVPTSASVVSEQPRSKITMAIRDTSEPPRRSELPKSNAHEMAQHDYLYHLDRSHASRGLPCFCCE